MVISQVVLMFHFNFQFTRTYFWIWKLWDQNKQKRALPVYSNRFFQPPSPPPPPTHTLIILQWIFPPLYLFRPHVYSGPKSKIIAVDSLYLYLKHLPFSNYFSSPLNISAKDTKIFSLCFFLSLSLPSLCRTYPYLEQKFLFYSVFISKTLFVYSLF